jgi:hypothetical protein
MLVENSDHRLAETAGNAGEQGLLGHRLAQPAEAGNDEMHAIGGHALGDGMGRVPRKQRPRHHLRLVEDEDARGAGFDRGDPVGDQAVAGAAPDRGFRRALAAAGDRGGDGGVHLLVREHDNDRFRLMQIGRGDEVGGGGGAVETDQPAALDRVLRHEDDLGVGAERQRQFLRVGIVADDHDVAFEPGGTPGDEALAKHHPEATEQGEVEHQRRREGAHQGDDILPAEKRAIEGERQQHRIERILPAGMALGIEQPAGDDEDDGKDRQRRDDQRQHISAWFRSAVVHRALPPPL